MSALYRDRRAAPTHHLQSIMCGIFEEKLIHIAIVHVRRNEAGALGEGHSVNTEKG